MRLDKLDLNILGLLQADAKTSYATIGDQVDLSVSAVNERIKKPQAKGVINGYTAVVNPAAIGLGICGFVQVLISDPSVEEGFLRAVEALDEVQECHTITGDFSYLLKIRARDAKSFEQFLRERIKILPGVLRSHSLIALTTSKETSRIPLPG